MAATKRSWLTRRKLLGGAVALGAVGWAGATAARLSRAPSAAKDAGRIADLDGIALPVETTIDNPFYDPALPWASQGGTINDVSALSRTPVYGIIKATEERHVADTLAFARNNNLSVSLAAVRHSMGGQAFDDHAIVLDLLGLNSIEVDEAGMTITVGPGATWHDIQNRLHPRFAVKSMQSTDIFSVGGSISVNAHGMDHQAGSVAGSIRSLDIMLADGSRVTCSRTVNRDLFRHVVGGYGLFGVILKATLEIVPNAVYHTARSVIRSDQFPDLFAREMAPDPGLGLFYGHLSTSPANFMEEMIVYRYDKVADQAPAEMGPLGEPGMVGVKRLMMNLAKRGDMFQRLKWYMEKELEPRFESCTVPRTAAMGAGEACLVSRNNPMHDSVPYLFNDLPEETDILHEYFFPRGEYNAFIAGAREILRKSPLPLLNASVRVVHAEDTALTYAGQDSFSLVLYINQKADEDGNAKMRTLTRELVDLTLRHRGRFFLPYQLHYTRAQLLAAYPELPAFLAKKRELDPDERFTSTFYRALRAAAGGTAS